MPLREEFSPGVLRLARFFDPIGFTGDKGIDDLLTDPQRCAHHQAAIRLYHQRNGFTAAAYQLVNFDRAPAGDCIILCLSKRNFVLSNYFCIMVLVDNNLFQTRFDLGSYRMNWK